MKEATLNKHQLKAGNILVLFSERMWTYLENRSPVEDQVNGFKSRNGVTCEAREHESNAKYSKVDVISRDTD